MIQSEQWPCPDCLTRSNIGQSNCPTSISHSLIRWHRWDEALHVALPIMSHGNDGWMSDPLGQPNLCL